MNKKYHLKYMHRQLPGDTLTPVGVYLRLRDVYPCSLLLECTDYSSRTNAFSYICLNPLMGIEAGGKSIRSSFPDGSEEISEIRNISGHITSFLDSIDIINDGMPEVTHGLFGFTSFESAVLFEKYDSVLIEKALADREVPLLRYDFYKVILTFNHFNNTLTVTEYYDDNLPCNESDRIMSLLANHNSTSWPFALAGEEQSDTDDLTFMKMVKEAAKHCSAGDVFQLVVSRRYRQKFSGDEFNVYRALRSVNPSPYLFYFDYISYRIFGSSPEAQIKVRDGKATINPIAGTIRRTGDIQADISAAKQLLADPKENSEHVMLVDLARNDLSRNCSNVQVEIYREVQTFSHLMHLVSTVTGDLPRTVSPYAVFADTFPAGTLSGAPKHKAIELISRLEGRPRGYYGGAIGYVGLDGTLNHAIIIRSFLSRDGFLNYQAGAGIVVNSSPANELNEVANKLDALRLALKQAVKYVNY
ncbi:MAG TPA: chorismate-binding protein [Bacteroidales bacterium]|nr:chorismate-binding protein [Bacteroidales bacterium]